MASYLRSPAIIMSCVQALRASLSGLNFLISFAPSFYLALSFLAEEVLPLVIHFFLETALALFLFCLTAGAASTCLALHFWL